MEAIHFISYSLEFNISSSVTSVMKIILILYTVRPIILWKRNIYAINVAIEEIVLPELKTLEGWISRLMRDPLFCIILSLS